MLELYYVCPDTWDRIRASWIGGPIERYVEWLNKNSYTATTVRKRVPILMEFGEFARQHGAKKLEELPGYIERFAKHWFKKHGQGCKTDHARERVKQLKKVRLSRIWGLPRLRHCEICLSINWLLKPEPVTAHISRLDGR